MAIVGYDARGKHTPPLHGEATNGRDEDGAFGRIANASFGAGLSGQAGGDGNAAANHRNRVQGAERREYAAVGTLCGPGTDYGTPAQRRSRTFESGEAGPLPGFASRAEVYSERRRGCIARRILSAAGRTVRGIIRRGVPLRRRARQFRLCPRGSLRSGSSAAGRMTLLSLAAHAKGRDVRNRLRADGGKADARGAVGS
jgi:hypothetical protein